MFVQPMKTKSGSGLSYVEAKSQVLQLVKDGKIDPVNPMGKTTQDFNDILDAYNNLQETMADTEYTEDSSQEIVDALESVIDVLNVCISTIQIRSTVTSDKVVSIVTVDSLQEEANNLKAILTK
jgi:hypothetical protein